MSRLLKGSVGVARSCLRPGGLAGGGRDDETAAATEYLQQRRRALGENDGDDSGEPEPEPAVEQTPALLPEPVPGADESTPAAQPPGPLARQVAQVADAVRDSPPPWALPDSPSAALAAALAAAPAAGAVAGLELDMLSAGALEAAAFGYLEHHMPGFDAANWTTSELSGGGGAAGYAFDYLDTEGLIGSSPVRETTSRAPHGVRLTVPIPAD